MPTCKFAASCFVLLLVAGFVINTADADIVAQLNSGDFQYLYEMNVNPSGQDLDGNTTNDFFSGTAGGSTIPQTYVGGVGFSNQGVGQNLFRTDINNSITRSTLANMNTPWTMEYRVMKNGGAQGVDGWFGAAMQNPGAAQSFRVNFEDDRVSYNNAGVNVDFLIGNDFTTDFHTMRVAYEGSNNFFVWVDDQLLNNDLTTASGFAGANGSFNGSGAWFIGDFSSGIAGDWQIDHIRYDAGSALAPVPEPTSFAMFGVIGMSLAFRRRR